MLDNPRGENHRRLPIWSPGVLGYCQGSSQCCHWYCQSFFKVGIDIFKDIFKVVIDIFEVVNCSLFTNLTTFPTKVLGIERKVIGQHHASAVLYEHRFIQNKQTIPILAMIIDYHHFKNTIRDGGSTALWTTDTVPLAFTVWTELKRWNINIENMA